MKESGYVGIFFYIKDKLYLHTCILAEAESYGDFLVFPYSHDQIWRECYQKIYLVDFDFFPRGRIVYCVSESSFWIYKDCCIPKKALNNVKTTLGKTIEKFDEHYVCNQCSKVYADIFEK